MNGAQWISANDAAAVLGCTPQHIGRLTRRGVITSKRNVIGRNGRGLAILLSSLPPAAQARYFTTHPELAAKAEETELREAAKSGAYGRSNDEQRRRADLRLKAVESYRAAMRVEGKRLEIQTAWLRAFRQANAELNVSIASVKRWCQVYDRQGIDGLVDGNDGHGRRGRFSIREELQDEFRALYLKPTKPTVALCYRELKKVAKVRGWELPSYHAFDRFAKSIPHATREFYRNGDRGKQHSSLRPFVYRDYSSFSAMEVIQSDHHQVDVAVHCGDPLCRAGHYPWITVWLDVRSRKVLGVDLYIEYPNSKRILEVLHRVFLEHGLAKAVYVDNGMDYIKAVGAWGVKHFDVGRRRAKMHKVEGWSEESLTRTLGPLGINAIFSIARNPQSKIIERFFLTLVGQLHQKFDSYRGALGDRSDRAEYLRTHVEELPLLSDLAVALDRVLEEYNSTPHRGEGMEGRSPNEIFEETRIPFVLPDRAALAIAFWTEAVATVQKNGIKFKSEWYRLDPEIQARYYAKKVVFRWHAEDLGEIVVCDGSGKFLCLGTPRTRGTYVRGDERTERAIAETQADWNAIKLEIRKSNPAAAKHLERVASTVEEYHAIVAEQQQLQPARVAAAGGAHVVQVDPYFSNLSRQVEAARGRQANSGLSAADRALIEHIPDISDERLEELLRLNPSGPRPVGCTEEDRTPQEAREFEIEAARLRRNRKLASGKCLAAGCERRATEEDPTEEFDQPTLCPICMLEAFGDEMEPEVRAVFERKAKEITE